MQNQSRFRKSDLSINGLDTLFSTQKSNRLRNSFDNNSVSPLKLYNYRITISHQQIPLLGKNVSTIQESKSSKNLKQKLSFLSEKLNNAKKEMITKQPIEKKTKQQIKSSDNLFLKIKQPLQTQSIKIATNEDVLRKSRKQQFIASQPKPTNLIAFKQNPYGSYKNNQYYISQVIRARHQKSSLAVQHINTSIALLKQCQKIQKIISSQQYEKINLPRLTQPNKKTLFIDLDETLIHCLDNTECEPDLKLKITIEGVAVDLDITIRPYALTFLKKICKKWEVVVFTASHMDYANAILNQIDPDNIIFHHRLYRQHCICVNDLYVKDLSRVNRDLGKVVLVDNAAYSYYLQLANAIPIMPYYDGKDFQLSALQTYLSKLQKLEDVRAANLQYFKLDQYSLFDNSSSLIEKLYVQ